ncbi:MAG: N-acetyltransferase family protein [Sphaerochaeta sp.]
MVIRAYKETDIPRMKNIWNEVVEEGRAFPQTHCLSDKEAVSFFASQRYCGVAEKKGTIQGLYILHPNNIGRVGHIANASYAVDSRFQGQGVGRALVEDSLSQLARFGFRIMQFNAVVATNSAAIHLYESLGFQRLGIIHGGFLMPDGSYEDIIPMVYYVDPVTLG